MLLRLLVVFGIVVSGTAYADANVSAPVALWRLESAETVGGLSAKVIGHPASGAYGGLVFGGKADGIFLENNPLAGATAFTIEICFRPDPDGPPEQRFFHAEDTHGSRVLLETRMLPGGRWALDTFLRAPTSRLTLLDRNKTHPAGRWTWVALTYADGTMRHYIDGVPELDGRVSFSAMTTGRLSLGVRQNLVSWFKGSIREIRIHHTALVPSALQRAE